MPQFKTCNNGHNYDAEQFAECPYCPSKATLPDYEKTLTDFKHTQIFDNNQQYKKTMINEETADFKTTPVFTGESKDHPFKRTMIAGAETANTTAAKQTEKRKLVGWLACFSHDDYGEDFRLYAGKNKIGSSSTCDIVVKDLSVSGEHTTILFRDNEFLIKDNFSTNGTKINGVSIDESKLKEGDELRLGNTVFKFKTVF